MKTLRLNLATYISRAPILIGLQGENEVRQIDFDFTKWVEQYGEGTITLAVQRHGDANPYPLTLESAGHIASWVVSSTDTEKEGKGEAQISYVVGGAVKKSEIVSFTVKRSLDSEGEVPDPYISWLEEVQAIGVQVSEDAGAASEYASVSADYAQAAKIYAREAKQAVIDTLEFADEGDGEIVITFNTEVN